MIKPRFAFMFFCSLFIFINGCDIKLRPKQSHSTTSAEDGKAILKLLFDIDLEVTKFRSEIFGPRDTNMLTEAFIKIDELKQNDFIGKHELKADEFSNVVWHLLPPLAERPWFIIMTKQQNTWTVQNKSSGMVVVAQKMDAATWRIQLVSHSAIYRHNVNLSAYHPIRKEW